MSVEIENETQDGFLNLSHADKNGYVKIEAVRVNDFAGEEVMYTEQMGQFRVRDILIALKGLV